MSNNKSTQRKKQSHRTTQVRETGNGEKFWDHIMNAIVANKNRFPLGKIVLTANAQRTLSQIEVASGLARHVTGDWSDMCEDDQHQNELALDQGLRIFSAFDNADRGFWIITEPDRSVTTILLPVDY